MTEYGTVKIKFSATYSEIKGIAAEDLKENMEIRLAEIGEIETSFEEDEEEVEFNGILKIDAQRNYVPASWENPGESEISVDIDEVDLRRMLQFNGNKPYIRISSEEWEAA